MHSLIWNYFLNSFVKALSPGSSTRGRSALGVSSAGRGPCRRAAASDAPGTPKRLAGDDSVLKRFQTLKRLHVNSRNKN